MQPCTKSSTYSGTQGSQQARVLDLRSATRVRGTTETAQKHNINPKKSMADLLLCDSHYTQLRCRLPSWQRKQGYVMRCPHESRPGRKSKTDTILVRYLTLQFDTQCLQAKHTDACNIHQNFFRCLDGRTACISLKRMCFLISRAGRRCILSCIASCISIYSSDACAFIWGAGVHLEPPP